MSWSKTHECGPIASGWVASEANYIITIRKRGEIANRTKGHCSTIANQDSMGAESIGKCVLRVRDFRPRTMQWNLAQAGFRRTSLPGLVATPRGTSTTGIKAI